MATNVLTHQGLDGLHNQLNQYKCIAKVGIIIIENVLLRG
jgi:hypothetical protein